MTSKREYGTVKSTFNCLSQELTDLCFLWGEMLRGLGFTAEEAGDVALPCTHTAAHRTATQGMRCYPIIKSCGLMGGLSENLPEVEALKIKMWSVPNSAHSGLCPALHRVRRRCSPPRTTPPPAPLLQRPPQHPGVALASGYSYSLYFSLY